MESLNCCRLMPFEIADGPTNMAADEALLESAIAGGAALRFYGWTEATLSLGYFQADSTRRADPILSKLPFVRRPTGGDAIVHHHELTYSLTLPPGHWQSGPPWMLRLHRIIVAALGGLGIPLTLVEHDAGGKPLLCFQHPTPGDVLLRGHKVVGSAQRRRRGALLQHGSILLAASEFAPQLPGIRELTGIELDADRAAEVINDRLEDETRWDVRVGVWTAEERDRTEELKRTRYAHDDWNRKR